MSFFPAGKVFLLACAAVCLLTAPHALAFRTVIVDAGHGGHDRGGIPGQRVSEKEVALDVAKRLKGYLQRGGVNVVMTRSGDYFVPLGRRTAIAAQYRDAVFVSVHFNSTPSNPNARGIETYYFSPKAFSLASAIHYRVVRTAGTGDRGIRRRGFYVLRKNRVPAVLLELGFLTNAGEARMAKSAGYRDKLAKTIAEGILSRR